jgi:hypothetical protein
VSSLLADPPHPIAAILRLLISTLFMPALVVLAWWKALQFDPYTMSFFTKTYIEPTPDMPDQFRIFGWIIVGIGALLLAALANGLWRRRVVFREIWTAIWMGLLVTAFGGAFFLAANRAEEAIASRGNE